MVERKFEKARDIYTSPSIYQITVQGKVDEQSIHSMTGMSVSNSGENKQNRLSTITGRVEDQSALNGLINTLFNQRLSVVSIIKIAR